MHNVHTDISGHFSTFCSTKNLKQIRDFIESKLNRSVPENDRDLIVLAVDEICSNSIIHGNHEDPNSNIDILLKYNQDELIVEIIDEGSFFDYSVYKEPSIEHLIDQQQKGSIGLLLVKHIMDKVEYVHEDDKNICRLVKKVPSA